MHLKIQGREEEQNGVWLESDPDEMLPWQSCSLIWASTTNNTEITGDTFSKLGSKVWALLTLGLYLLLLYSAGTYRRKTITYICMRF